MTNSDGFPAIVQLARCDAERDAIYQLRYDVYVTEQGKRYTADHERRELRDARDEDGEHLYVASNGGVVAAVRVHLGGDPPHPSLPAGNWCSVERARVAFVSRLVVTRSRRGGIVTPLLFRAALRFVLENDVRFGVTWCVPALACLYERVGFRRYAAAFADPVVGELVPLAFDTEDLGYLQAIGSILADVAEAA